MKEDELTQADWKTIYAHLYEAYWMMAKCEKAMSKANQVAGSLHPVYNGLQTMLSGNCEMLLSIAGGARDAAAIIQDSREDQAIQRKIDKIKV